MLSSGARNCRVIRVLQEGKTAMIETALVTPREKPAGGSDPFFSQVNSELADKGRSLLCFTSHHVSILRIHATSSGLSESCP